MKYFRFLRQGQLGRSFMDSGVADAISDSCLLLATAYCPRRITVGAGGRAKLVITEDKTERLLTTAELLGRSDGRLVTVQTDLSPKPITYHAVPLLSPLGDINDKHFDTLEAWATDGFVSQIPLALTAGGAKGGAIAWIAIDDPAHPWPDCLARRTRQARST